MNHKDQKLVDHLFERIFLQKIRYAFFSKVPPKRHPNIRDKSNDEKEILEDFIAKYKKFYQDKAEELKKKLNEKKEYDISSYFAYDTEYYINEYNNRVEEVNKYLVELENKTNDQIDKDDLSFVSEKINALYPNFIPKPNLLGLL